jgi:aminopeptidase N
MLRTLMEDARAQNPDAGFIAMMHDFTSTYAGKNASTEEFRRIVEKHVGQSMEWFFSEWVYDTEIPRYEFSYQLKPGEGGKTVLQASVTQSGVSDQFLMKVPVYLHMNGQPRRLGFVSVKGSATVNGEIPLPFHPEKVTLDEYHSILCRGNQ